MSNSFGRACLGVFVVLGAAAISIAEAQQQRPAAKRHMPANVAIDTPPVINFAPNSLRFQMERVAFHPEYGNIMETVRGEWKPIDGSRRDFYLKLDEFNEFAQLSEKDVKAILRQAERDRLIWSYMFTEFRRGQWTAHISPI